MAMSSIDDIKFFNPIGDGLLVDWSNHTLIFPVSSIGNVAQLTVDLLISTLSHKKQCQLVGRFYSKSLMSFAGPNPIEMHGEPVTSSEAYESPPLKLIIVQQRTSCCDGQRKNYISHLCNWIQECKFKRVVMVSSAYSHFAQPTESPVKFYYTSDVEGDSPAILNLLDGQQAQLLQTQEEIPGSGITRHVAKEFQKRHIEASIIMCYCSEGENVSESHLVMKELSQALRLNITAADIIEPFSWEPAKYGGPPAGLVH